MNFYKDHYKILDAIRRDRGMSVTQLCEGIIAERTYYRYLKSTGPFNMDAFIKLARRLHIEPSQLVIYSVFFKDGDPGTVKFIYRVGVEYYNDIKEHYEKVKAYVSGSSDYDLLLKAFISEYEYKANFITKEQHVENLKGLISKIENFSAKNIFHLTIYVFYAQVMGEVPHFTLLELGKLISEVDFRFSYIVTCIATERMLGVLIDYAPDEKATYERLFKANANLTLYNAINHFQMQNMKYEAFYELKNGNKEKSLKHLYKYAVAASALMREDAFNHTALQVQKHFGIDLLRLIRASK